MFLSFKCLTGIKNWLKDIIETKNNNTITATTTMAIWYWCAMRATNAPIVWATSAALYGITSVSVMAFVLNVHAKACFRQVSTLPAG